MNLVLIYFEFNLEYFIKKNPYMMHTPAQQATESQAIEILISIKDTIELAGGNCSFIWKDTNSNSWNFKHDKLRISISFYDCWFKLKTVSNKKVIESIELSVDDVEFYGPGELGFNLIFKAYK